jgi:hypothetical protein
VTLIPVAVIDEPAPLSDSPLDPSPFVAIVAPVIYTAPPTYATTPGTLVPLVTTEVAPLLLTPIVIVPPFSASTPFASVPAVAIDPPRIDVVAPVEVMTPYI